MSLTSVAATWLLKPQISQIPLRVQLEISSIQIEECTIIGNQCYCDALILYEVGSLGHLKERIRTCGLESSISIGAMEPRFLLAFFTDLEDLPGGAGFMASYEGGTYTTSDDWETTTEGISTTSRTTPEPTEETTEYGTTKEPGYCKWMNI